LGLLPWRRKSVDCNHQCIIAHRSGVGLLTMELMHSNFFNKAVNVLLKRLVYRLLRIICLSKDSPVDNQQLYVIPWAKYTLIRNLLFETNIYCAKPKLIV
jgi:hypothetical protein